ncbi:Germin-like protein subfamily 1 member 14 [Cardamine amara subsp. amara]|uniref:Germin-like protein subfamily 1 member 14 n=1 Tax=Cardamine amara subsp. amara TaxID=228776 RepID=A0ABD0Z4G7_CARAN
MFSKSLILITISALVISFAKAYDPSPLQDFCVAINDLKNGDFVNGKFCKDPKQVKAEDFFYVLRPQQSRKHQ